MGNKRIENMGFVWNTLASLAAAFSSVIVLLIVTRNMGVNEAAIFSMAIAISTVLMNVGSYNIIGYQVTDIEERFSFDIYLKFRKITVGIMIALGLIYVLIMNYDQHKAIVIVLYCLYKAINVYYDVYQGRYQQKGRMDLASKANFFKVLIPDGLLCILVIVEKNIIVAILAAIGVEIIYVIIYNKVHFEQFRSPKECTLVNIQIINLALACLPLFLGAFASAYILNSSKYAIDRCMTEEYQTYYAILLLPATTVHMFAGFIYRPLLTKFATLWLQKRIEKLKKIIYKIVGIIILLGCIVCSIGIPVGIPILSFLYGVPELKEYGHAFVILLLAGTLNALNALASYLLTLMRLQKNIYLNYGITLIMALLFTDMWVTYFGLVGAAYSFLILMLLQLFANACIIWKKGFQAKPSKTY